MVQGGRIHKQVLCGLELRERTGIRGWFVLLERLVMCCVVASWDGSGVVFPWISLCLGVLRWVMCCFGSAGNVLWIEFYVRIVFCCVICCSLHIGCFIFFCKCWALSCVMCCDVPCFWFINGYFLFISVILNILAFPVIASLAYYTNFHLVAYFSLLADYKYFICF